MHNAGLELMIGLALEGGVGIAGSTAGTLVLTVGTGNEGRFANIPGTGGTAIGAGTGGAA